MLNNILARATGVLHVGANHGQERDIYHHHGLKVVWIEALPEAFAILARHIADFPKQSAIEALVTDVPGQSYKFNIANNQGASSSILNLAKHRDIWPGVDFVGQIDLVSTTLDQLVTEGKLDISGIDTLVLDTQGSELLVLKGAERLLKSIRFLKVEAADFEAYEGCTTADELEKWLQSKRYRLLSKSVFAQHPSGGIYCDMLFELALDDVALLRVAEELQILGGTIAAYGMSDIGLQISAVASAFDRAIPEPFGWWSNPFNGQSGRTKFILDLLKTIPFSAILETGTFRGNTTRFFGENFKGPIHTCDIEARWVMTAKHKLASFASIEVEQCDARAFLARHLASKDAPLFIYLDAHWGVDLPLAEELGLIIASGKACVVVIDDFAVPGDPGYSFDDYGPGKRLTTELLATIDPKGAALFFPSLPSSHETGAKRGCAIIATGAMIEALNPVPDFKRVAWPQAEGVKHPPRLMIIDTIAPIRRLLTAGALEQNVGKLQQDLQVLQNKYDALQRDHANAMRELQARMAQKPL